MDPPPEEAAFVVEELDPPRPRTRRGELEIFYRFLAFHVHDNSIDANKDVATNPSANLVAVKEAITCMLQMSNKSQAIDHEIIGDKMVNLLVEAMLSYTTLYIVFNKREVEDFIEDQLISSYNEIIQKINSTKGQASESLLDLARNMRGTFG